VCGGKNSFRALAKKEKLLGAWDQGTAQGRLVALARAAT